MNKTQKKKAQKKLKADLCQSLKQGTLLYLDGRLAAPSHISDRMIQEEGSYMADYITDEKGCIREIHYNKIKI